MDDKLLQAAALMLKHSTEFLSQIPRKLKNHIDDIEIIFANDLNGRKRFFRAFTIIEMLEVLEDGGQPIGMLLINEEESEKMMSKEFPGITEQERELLAHAFAEAQDQVKESFEDN